MFEKVVCLCGLQWLCLLSVGDLKVNVSAGGMSLRTAMVVSSYEHKRKSKSNIVCLCGLQWLCLLSVGDLKVHVSAGGMSLRTAMVVSCYEHKRKSKSNIVCLCGLQWLCLLSVGDLKVNVWKGRMSLWIAMIVFVKCGLQRKRGNRRKCVKSWLRVAERCDEFLFLHKSICQLEIERCHDSMHHSINCWTGKWFTLLCDAEWTCGVRVFWFWEQIRNNDIISSILKKSK